MGITMLRRHMKKNLAHIDAKRKMVEGMRRRAQHARNMMKESLVKLRYRRHLWQKKIWWIVTAVNK